MTYTLLLFSYSKCSLFHNSKVFGSSIIHFCIQGVLKYIYSTNIDTEYFKHGIYSPFYFPLQYSVYFIILYYFVSCIIHFCIQGVLKYIYSTNMDTEYFKQGIYSPFYFPIQNAVYFIILKYLVPVLFTFCIQDVLKIYLFNKYRY
jgi:hypothetical protein